MSLRRFVANSLDPSLKTTPGLSLANKIIMLIIGVSLVFAILETEPLIYRNNETVFLIAEWVFMIVFSVEYIARVWASIENPNHTSRIRYMLTPAVLLDLLTVILILLTTMGTEGFVLRLARLLRVLRIAKLGRYSVAIQIISQAVYLRRFELSISFALSVFALILSSSVLYFVEGVAQPDAFGSIPRAMWWSIATLTTVGYGDVHPITPLGKFFAAITAVVGIVLIAMPIGILTASLSEAIRKIKDEKANKR